MQRLRRSAPGELHRRREVTLSGEGKLGLSYQKDAIAQEWEAISSANVKFTLSGTSDNDMISEFGASFTLDAE